MDTQTKADQQKWVLKEGVWQNSKCSCSSLYSQSLEEQSLVSVTHRGQQC